MQGVHASCSLLKVSARLVASYRANSIGCQFYALISLLGSMSGKGAALNEGLRQRSEARGGQDLSLFPTACLARQFRLVTLTLQGAVCTVLKLLMGG